MTTATIPQSLARAAKPDREPEDAVLRLHPHFVTDERGEPAKFYARCFAFEQRKVDLLASTNKLLESVADDSVRNLLSGRDAMRESWHGKAADLVTEFVSLGWQKRDLLFGAGPAHARQIAEFRDAYEKAVADEITNLRDLGIDKALPASGKNEKAAEQQLRHRAESQDWVLAVKADLNCALEAERIRKAILEGLPTYQSFTISWPEFDLPDVANLIGLERTTTPEVLPLSDAARRVARDFGLADTPLLAVHVAALEQLGEFGKDQIHPLLKLNPQKREESRELIGQLPKTSQTVQYLANSAGGRDPYRQTI